MTVQKSRRRLLHLFDAALATVDGRTRVRAALAETGTGSISHVIAIGKAAAGMAAGADDVLGEQVQAGLAITKEGHCAPLPDRYQCLESAHPEPDERSLGCGRRLIEFLARAPDEASFLFLISGGASALVDVLPDGVTVSDLSRLNAWLLASGLAIGEMNRVRQAVSCIKAGRLARLLRGRSALQLLMSDVPGDDPATIGSGLLVAPRPAPLPQLPPHLASLIAAGQAPMRPDDPAFREITTWIIARNGDAVEGAARAAVAEGLPVHGMHRLEGDVLDAGRQIAACLADGRPGVYLWGGETTVRLPAHPGRGGRNQALALAAAIALQGRTDVAVLAAGTDGSDGPTEDTGGLVDGATVARGEVRGLDARHCLATANAGTFLEASGDLVRTGPTGTNVMDLVIGLKWT